jgi:hypothetical protein
MTHRSTFTPAGNELGNLLNSLHGRINTPLTEQQVQDINILTNVVDAEKVIGLNGTYSISELLQKFYDEYNDSSRKSQGTVLINAKNIALRHLIVKNIKETGGFFDTTEAIPFKMACTRCKGHGELYSFHREARQHNCHHCDTTDDGKATGRKTITCPDCKGSRVYKKRVGGGPHDIETVDCTKCDKDSEGRPTGKWTFKCRPCRGTGRFEKLGITHAIKSTTVCFECSGTGFLTKQQLKAIEKSRKLKGPANPVISTDLATKIKATVPHSEKYK